MLGRVKPLEDWEIYNWYLKNKSNKDYDSAELNKLKEYFKDYPFGPRKAQSVVTKSIPVKPPTDTAKKKRPIKGNSVEYTPKEAYAFGMKITSIAITCGIVAGHAVNSALHSPNIFYPATGAYFGALIGGAIIQKQTNPKSKQTNQKKIIESAMDGALLVSGFAGGIILGTTMIHSIISQGSCQTQTLSTIFSFNNIANSPLVKKSSAAALSLLAIAYGSLAGTMGGITGIFTGTGATFTGYKLSELVFK